MKKKKNVDHKKNIDKNSVLKKRLLLMVSFFLITYFFQNQLYATQVVAFYNRENFDDPPNKYIVIDE